MPQLGERGCISVVKEIADSDLLQKVLERFDQPGWPSQIGSLEAEIEGTQLVLRYTGTGTKFGKFKTMVEIPQAVGDDDWNRYVQPKRPVQAHWPNSLPKPNQCLPMRPGQLWVAPSKASSTPPAGHWGRG